MVGKEIQKQQMKEIINGGDETQKSQEIKNKKRKKESGQQRKYRRTLEGFAGLPPRR